MAEIDRDDVLASLADELLGELYSEAAEIGQGLSDAVDEVAEYTAARIDHLAGIVGEPGFFEAVRAERDSVLLKAAAGAVAEADALDRRLASVVSAGLRVGARALAAIVSA